MVNACYVRFVVCVSTGTNVAKSNVNAAKDFACF